MVSCSAGAGGAQHVEPVERGLGLDLLGLALVGEGAVGDLELEVLGDLVLVDHAPDALPDRAGVGVVQATAGVRDRCCDLVQFALGRGEQVLALARALGSEVRVAAYHESLVGELG